jgi:hypothetical protein
MFHYVTEILNQMEASSNEEVFGTFDEVPSSRKILTYKFKEYTKFPLYQYEMCSSHRCSLSW